MIVIWCVNKLEWISTIFVFGFVCQIVEFAAQGWFFTLGPSDLSKSDIKLNHPLNLESGFFFLGKYDIAPRKFVPFENCSYYEGLILILMGGCKDHSTMV